MARHEWKFFQRDYEPGTGRDVYTSDSGDISYDLSSMRFLYSGIDTLRQLYNCNLKLSRLVEVIDHMERYPGQPIEVGGIEWKISKGGGKSGYQFILKNQDLGLIVLLKSFYCDADQRGAHLKLEASPILIYEKGLSGLTSLFRQVASEFGDTVEATGLAVHLFVDMKGLELPDDFEQKLATRSKRAFKANGISDASFSASEAAFVYGRGDTYTFGNAGQLQMCLYNKTLEALKSGKLNWMEDRWRCTPSIDNFPESEYRDGSDGEEADTVHRLEFRIHHSVIRQFELGNYEHHGGERMDCIREPVDLLKHLNALWQYCLKNFRLQHSSIYIHPIWQRLTEDVVFAEVEHEHFFYKRCYNNPLKKLDGTKRRNVAMWLGNVIKLAALKGLTTEHVCKWLLSGGLESEIARYFGLRAFGHDDEVWMSLFSFVDERLTNHRLNGIAA